MAGNAVFQHKEPPEEGFLGVANLPGGFILFVVQGIGESVTALRVLLVGTSMSTNPQLSGEQLLNQLRARFEQLCQDVAQAVNQAPAGQVINASEEKVRDLLAAFRQTTYQNAVQLRLDAAQAAFPPSEAPPDESTVAEQGT
jgi:type VI protein secretion system component VasK